MIDFSPVYNNGLIVNCKTIEDSIAFFIEVRAEFGMKYRGALAPYTHLFLEQLHYQKKDQVAYRLVIIDGALICNRASIHWYREQKWTKKCKFVEFSTKKVGNEQEIVEFDTIFNDQIDISLLFGGELNA